MTEHKWNAQTRSEDTLQHIRLLDNALSINLYHAAEGWLNYVIEDIDFLELEAENFLYSKDRIFHNSVLPLQKLENGIRLPVIR